MMTALLTITTVFYIVLAAVSARRKTPAARFFALMVGLAAVWTATVIGEMNSAELSTKIAWMQGRLMFICFIPFAWLGLVLSLTGKFSTFKKPFFALLLIIPTATAILALTTRFHNQFRCDFAIESIRGMGLLVFKRSHWDVLHEVNNHAISLLGFFILLSAWPVAPANDRLRHLVHHPADRQPAVHFRAAAAHRHQPHAAGSDSRQPASGVGGSRHTHPRYHSACTVHGPRPD